MDYKAKAEEIDKFLRENGLKQAKKSDLKAIFNIDKDIQSAIWSALGTMGYSVYWSYVERHE